MVDFFDPGGGSPGTSFVQTAYQRDPRAIMAALLMRNAQEGVNQPSPNPLSALARAFTMGVSAIPQAVLAKEYQGRDEAARKTMADALSAMDKGTTRDLYDPGIPGTTQPTTTTEQVDQPGMGAALKVLAANPDTASLGMSQALALGLAGAKSRLEAQNEFAKRNLQPVGVDAAGRTVYGPIGGAQETEARGTQLKAGAEKAGALPYVGPTAQAQAAGTAQGELPLAGALAQARSSGTAAGELPFVGPKAAAQAAGSFYAVPQKSEPGSTFVQMQPGGTGGAPAGTQVYANPNPSPGTQPGHIDTFLSDTFKGYEETAQKGRDKIASMQQLNSMIGDIETGKFTGSTLDLMKVAQRAGLSTAGMNEKTGRLEAAKGLGQQLALEGRNFPGQVSNYEQQILQSMAPGIETTPQGRQQMLAIAQARQQRNEEVAQIGRDMLTDPNSGGRLSVGYLTKLEEYAKKNGLTGVASPAAAAAPQMTATGPDGKRIGWNGSQWVPLK